jgi:hypothetical protein
MAEQWLTRTVEPRRMPEPATCDPAQGIDRMGSMSDEPDGLDRLQKLSPCDRAIAPRYVICDNWDVRFVVYIR